MRAENVVLMYAWVGSPELLSVARLARLAKAGAGSEVVKDRVEQRSGVVRAGRPSVVLSQSP